MQKETELSPAGGTDVVLGGIAGKNESTVGAIAQGKSWFGLSDSTVGIIMLIVAAMIGSVDSHRATSD